ncbi:MAG: nucleotidyltransferase domain-containing protein [Clostridia bacterium]|nr:nucleotidyltransferase domain-containing protein [Clostridia bacterium]
MCKLVPLGNGKSVADIKYGHVMNIAEKAAACKHINRIMLFGSAIEDRCAERSDIDIAVFGTQPKAQYYRSKEFKRFQDEVYLYDTNQDYDILYFMDGHDSNAPILRDINRGVEIYRRVPA